MGIIRKSSLALSTFTLLIVALRSISAQLTWEQDYRGRKISCGVSGLRGFGDPCGFENYDAAFVGRIISSEELPGDEFQLVVSPTEKFKGDLPATVTLRTRSGACMPEFVIGQDWLFSARRDEKSKELLLWFGSPSGPLPASKKNVEQFRLLVGLKDSGLIVGDVSDSSRLDSREPRAGQRVVVRSIPAGVEYVEVTDSVGHFEFPPLPVGKYTIDPNTVPSLWSEDGGDTTVRAHECRNYHIDMLMDGSIAGAVILPTGDTSRTWQVEAVPLDQGGSLAASAFTDDTGHFVLRGLSPGRYVIGIEVVGVSSDMTSTSVYMLLAFTKGMRPSLST
jgi:hypothetical protein